MLTYCPAISYTALNEQLAILFLTTMSTKAVETVDGLPCTVAIYLLYPVASSLCEPVIQRLCELDMMVYGLKAGMWDTTIERIRNEFDGIMCGGATQVSHLMIISCHLSN